MCVLPPLCNKSSGTRLLCRVVSLAPFADLGPGPRCPAALRAPQRRRFAIEMNQKYVQSSVAAAAMAPPRFVPPPLETGGSSTPFPETWGVQFAVLWMRAFKYKLREPAAVRRLSSACALLLGDRFTYKGQSGSDASLTPPALAGDDAGHDGHSAPRSHRGHLLARLLPQLITQDKRCTARRCQPLTQRSPYIPRRSSCRHISLRQSAIYDRLSCISFIILMQVKDSPFAPPHRPPSHTHFHTDRCLIASPPSRCSPRHSATGLHVL